MQVQGLLGNIHQGTDCRSGHSLNTPPAISLRCLADCRSELLVAESTRWPALVLQPTRQVSPTTIGESIPDSTTPSRSGLRTLQTVLNGP
ncbi:unnamed protein product, partial [Staurois parvus]